MDTTKYNGWTNHATWCCKLWMDNDEGLYHTHLDMVRQASGNERRLAEALEEFWGEFIAELHDNPKRNDTQNALLQDFTSFGLEQVNWQEIAEHMIEDNETEAATA